MLGRIHHCNYRPVVGQEPIKGRFRDLFHRARTTRQSAWGSCSERANRKLTPGAHSAKTDEQESFRERLFAPLNGFEGRGATYPDAPVSLDQPSHRVERKLAAILAADVVGFSRLME